MRDHLRRAAELLDEAVAELEAAAKVAPRFWRAELRLRSRAVMALAVQIVQALDSLG